MSGQFNWVIFQMQYRVTVVNADIRRWAAVNNMCETCNSKKLQSRERIVKLLYSGRPSSIWGRDDWVHAGHVSCWEKANTLRMIVMWSFVHSEILCQYCDEMSNQSLCAVHVAFEAVAMPHTSDVRFGLIWKIHFGRQSFDKHDNTTTPNSGNGFCAFVWYASMHTHFALDYLNYELHRSNHCTPPDWLNTFLTLNEDEQQTHVFHTINVQPMGFVFIKQRNRLNMNDRMKEEQKETEKS